MTKQFVRWSDCHEISISVTKILQIYIYLRIFNDLEDPLILPQALKKPFTCTLDIYDCTYFLIEGRLDTVVLNLCSLVRLAAFFEGIR